MLKILKGLKESILSIIAIFLLLIVQATCELALPHYTSKIVDIGIQQSGIENSVPLRIPTVEMEKVMLFMDESGYTAVQRYYNESEGAYTLNDTSDNVISELDNIFALPETIVFSIRKMSPDTVKSNFDGHIEDSSAIYDYLKAMPEEQRKQAVEEIELQFSGMSSIVIRQMSAQYLKSVYQESGVNINTIQFGYLRGKAVVMILYVIVMTAASVMVAFLSARTAALFGMKLRSMTFRKVVSFSNAEMDKFSTASLITRSTNDIQQVQMVIVMLLRMVIYAPILGIGGLIKVNSTKTGLGWIIGVALGAVLAVVIILITVAMPKFKRMQILVDKLNLVTREILTGLPVIRAFSREKHEEQRFNTANMELMKTQLFTNRAMTFMFPTMMLIMNSISVIILWVGGYGIDAGNLQVGDMVAFITYTMQIIMSFLMITMVSIMLPRAAVSAKRINEVLESDISVKDRNITSSLKNVRGEIVFNNVDFRYNGADENVLNNISFTAMPGEITAIIGSTGCGKSTLINLIPRFFDVTDGKITIDGVDIRDISQHQLREMIGFVPQKAVLFSGTIASNLRFGNQNAQQSELQDAAEIAQSIDFIEEKPDKYESHVSQGGTNVSGGQKQRLSIARAIVKRPKIFIFDDSFSALDYKTDVKLRKAIKEKVGFSTIIIVAQRVSTIINADQIIVLDDGEIAGIGTHKELMESCNVYQQIAISQLSESELNKGRGE